MVSSTFSDVECSDCGRALHQAPDTPLDDVRPCAGCGSKARTFRVEFRNEIVLRSLIVWKQKRPGEKKPIVEGKRGADWNHDVGEFREIEQVADRQNNRYSKKVTRPNGEIVREVDEPLSEHRGRGSARRANKS